MTANDELGNMGGKFWGLILRNYLDILPEELRKTTNELRSRVEHVTPGISGSGCNSDIQNV
jgi:hypothetical protein